MYMFKIFKSLCLKMNMLLTKKLDARNKVASPGHRSQNAISNPAIEISTRISTQVETGWYAVVYVS